MDEQHDEVFKALSDPHRRRIIAALCKKPMVAGDLGRLVSLAPNAVSFHLRLLQEAKLVSARRQGRFIWYRVEREVLDGWRSYAQELLSVGPGAESIEAHVSRPPGYAPPAGLRLTSQSGASQESPPVVRPEGQDKPAASEREVEEKLPDELL